MCRCANFFKWSVVCVAVASGSSLSCDQLHAQSGLRESLERLDTNEDGQISPEEITPRSRPYLERIAKSHRLSLDAPNQIDKLQEAARIHHALVNGAAGKRIVPEGEASVLPFGPKPDEPLVPEFGLPEVKYPYIQADLDEADRTLRRSDQDKDGYIDRGEAMNSEWTHLDPFESDLNKDDRLSRLELTQRYARRRLLSGAAEELVRKAWRTGGDIRPSTPQKQERDDSQWWRKGGSRYWLTATVLGRFDTNRNGRLEWNEAQDLGIPPGKIDVDRDGELTRDELHAFLTELQDEAGDDTEGLPAWFHELDVNRDEQVAMFEFASEWTDEKAEEFALLDTNQDGLLTKAEAAQSKALVGGSYHNQTAEALPPRRTIISEIEVDEDYLVGDLNVQLSITHTNTSFLDAYLTGPDGQRIELFAEVGGGGDHFDQTILDDQSQHPIVKAKPPFKGTFLPGGVVKRQPGLSHFNGKSVKGVWQLVIRGTRSERFGMLHSWSLIVRPQDEMLSSAAVAPLRDGPQASAIPAGPAPPATRQTVTKREMSPDEAKRKWEEYKRAQASKGKIDYEEVGKRIVEAVKAGKLTEEQAKAKWDSIKKAAGAKEKWDKSQGDKAQQERWQREKELEQKRGR